MNAILFLFTMIGLIAGMALSSEFAVENRDKQLIGAWCRSEHTEIAAYENCVKNSKPKWWPKENQ